MLSRKAHIIQRINSAPELPQQRRQRLDGRFCGHMGPAKTFTEAVKSPTATTKQAHDRKQRQTFWSNCVVDWYRPYTNKRLTVNGRCDDYRPSDLKVSLWVGIQRFSINCTVFTPMLFVSVQWRAVSPPATQKKSRKSPGRQKLKKLGENLVDVYV